MYYSRRNKIDLKYISSSSLIRWVEVYLKYIELYLEYASSTLEVYFKYPWKYTSNILGSILLVKVISTSNVGICNKFIF